MPQLTYKEAYGLSMINMKPLEGDIKKISQVLLGVYVCQFLDFFEEKGDKEGKTLKEVIDEYFQSPEDVWANETLLYPVFKRLKKKNILKSKEKKIFKQFNCIKFKPKSGNSLKFQKDIDKFIQEALHPCKSFEKSQKVISSFSKKLLEVLKKFNDRNSKFELRFFWKNDTLPQVYDLFDLFEEKAYVREKNKDKYLKNDKKSVSKIRKHHLEVKEFTHEFHNIEQFKEKKKIKTDGPSSDIIEVIKERYIRKIEPHAKIEFAKIWVKDEPWKTICIESKKLEIVLALSLLIDQSGSEQLTYSEFLNKFYSL